MAFYSSKTAALDAIGRHNFANEELAKKLTYASGAGTPTATSTVPEFIGQYYLDTSNNIWYKATATAAVTDFKALNA